MKKKYVILSMGNVSTDVWAKFTHIAEAKGLSLNGAVKHVFGIPNNGKVFEEIISNFIKTGRVYNNGVGNLSSVDIPKVEKLRVDVDNSKNIIKESESYSWNVEDVKDMPKSKDYAWNINDVISLD